MNSAPQIGHIHPSFKHKISVQIRKTWRKSNSREGKQNSPGAEGVHGRASQVARPCAHHHEPWWKPWVARLAAAVPSLLGRCVLCSFWFASFCLGSSDLGLLGFLCSSSWLSWPQFLTFLLKLGSTCTNLQSELDKAKIERNRRNICINRKMIQINPKIWAQII